MMNDMNLKSSQRGFPVSEFEQRTQNMQAVMRQHQMDAFFLTEEVNVRYFTGFHSQFWQSPTRPWFVVIPTEGKPIAIIPEIGVSGMRSTWIDDIYSWPSPCPEDDGISLVTKVINDLPTRFGRVGAMLGAETSLRMPYKDFQQMCQMSNKQFIDATSLLHALRQIKSPAEINKIRDICCIAGNAFSQIVQYAKTGMKEREICHNFKQQLLLSGADDCPYIIAGSGPSGYDSIIMGPSDRTLNPGDVLVIDTGSIRDGYFCDFDRNWAFDYAHDDILAVHRIIYEATTKGFEAAYPGNKTSDIFHAMWEVLSQNNNFGNNIGRLGHGLGMQLTETPSITATDETVIKPGMVLTLEPSMTYAENKSMVHEENIVITEEGAEWITTRVSPELTVIKT